MVPPSRDILLKMYQDMARIRRFEETTEELHSKGLIPGAVHLSIGMEAVAVGACTALRADDYITSTHRSHGHAIAKGVELSRLMAELMGRRAGVCKGKGGSMHLADFSRGILGACAIVGGNLPIATGAALAAKLRGSGQVALCFFGDGAANTGTVHESMNLAAIWKLPVIYLLEHNGFSEFTPAERVQSVTNLAMRAQGYNMPGHTIDGNNVLEIYHTVSSAAERARGGQGPSFIEAKTYRLRGHSAGEDIWLGGATYRDPQEIEARKTQDPLPHFRRWLTEQGQASEAELAAIDHKVLEAVQQAVAFAQASALPKGEEALDDVYA